jgi:hypothetical protein
VGGLVQSLWGGAERGGDDSPAAEPAFVTLPPEEDKVKAGDKGESAEGESKQNLEEHGNEQSIVAPLDILSLIEDEPGSASENNEALVISEYDIQNWRQNMNEADKQQFFQIMMKKFPAEGWQELTAILEGGIKREEMNDLQVLAETYLTNAEMQQLFVILQKAG